MTRDLSALNCMLLSTLTLISSSRKQKLLHVDLYDANKYPLPES